MSINRAAKGRIVHVTVNPGENNGSDVAPAMIVSVWPSTPDRPDLVNLKVQLDSTGEHPSSWLTSVPLYASREHLEEQAEKRHGFDGVPRPFGAYWPPRT